VADFVALSPLWYATMGYSWHASSLPWAHLMLQGCDQPSTRAHHRALIRRQHAADVAVDVHPRCQMVAHTVDVPLQQLGAGHASGQLGLQLGQLSVVSTGVALLAHEVQQLIGHSNGRWTGCLMRQPSRCTR
jgi:hypothetical protein